MQEKYLEDANSVARDEILEHVALSVLRNARANTPGIAHWVNGAPLKEPLKIYDLNGKLLFLDYPVKQAGETLGTIRAAASAILGAPTVAHEIGPRSWNFDAAVRKLTPQVKKAHPRWRFLGTKLVCYSYPKLGVMFEAQNEDGKPARLIFDVASLTPISEKSRAPGNEGVYAWSFYDSLSEEMRAERLKLYRQYEKGLAGISQVQRSKIVKVKDLSAMMATMGKLLVFKTWATKLLQYCSHYDYDEARSHHCFTLKGQQYVPGAEIATCQMILCFYRYYYSQEQIAQVLHNDLTADEIVAGYEELAHNHLVATYEPAPTWETLQAQIDALQPVRDAVTGHARACAGYHSAWWPFFARVKQLYIYDPWPWNSDYKLGGTVYWEDWGTFPHHGFVLTRIASS